MSEELKPCPFCGCKVDWCDCSGTCHMIECDHCRLQIHTFHEDAYTKGFDTSESLRKLMASAWNRRAGGDA